MNAYKGKQTFDWFFTAQLFSRSVAGAHDHGTSNQNMASSSLHWPRPSTKNLSLKLTASLYPNFLMIKHTSLVSNDSFLFTGYEILIRTLAGCFSFSGEISGYFFRLRTNP